MKFVGCDQGCDIWIECGLEGVKLLGLWCDLVVAFVIGMMIQAVDQLPRKQYLLVDDERQTIEGRGIGSLLLSPPTRNTFLCFLQSSFVLFFLVLHVRSVGRSVKERISTLSTLRYCSTPLRILFTNSPSNRNGILENHPPKGRGTCRPLQLHMRAL